MASDLAMRIFSQFQAAPSVNKGNFVKKLLTPTYFPLLRYTAEYALSILVIAFFIAFVMHMLMSALLRLIVLPGWPGAF